jgi:UDP-glucuronate 4-epimerase
MQPGDVPATYADTSRLTAWTGYEPGTPIREGIAKFVEWYLRFYSAVSN